MMGVWALILASVLYAVVAVDQGIRRDWPMSVIFAAYAVANAAYILVAYRS